MNNENQNAESLVPVNNGTPALAFILLLIGPYRCITFKSQLPLQELMYKLLLITEMLLKLINSLMQENENNCAFIEILVLELIYFIMLNLNIIRNKTNKSKVIGFTWKLFKLLANVVEATTLVVFRFDKMESDHFKREFIL